MDFCPDQLFANQTMEASHLKVSSKCAQDTVLVGIPVGILALTSIPHLCQAFSKSTLKTATNKRRTLCNVKMALTMILLLNAIIKCFYSRESVTYPSGVFRVSCLICGCVLSLLLTHFAKRNVMNTSMPLFLFWASLSLGQVPFVIDQLENITEESNVQEILLAATFYPVTIIQLILSCWSDIKTSDGDLAPELQASYPSVLMFSWFNSLIWKGFKKPLEQPDLPPNPKTIDVKENVLDFLKNGKAGSIWCRILKTHWRSFIVGLFMGTVYNIVSFISPQVLKLLLQHIDSEDPAWQGYILAALLFGNEVLATVMFNQYWHRVQVISMQIRNGIISVIYRKSLKLSNRARLQFTVGEVTNLMSVDANKVFKSTPYIFKLWKSTLTICLAMYFLYQELGTATFAGASMLLILIPVNALIARMTEALEKAQLESKDSRIKIMNEILKGIKILKLNAWEYSFMDRISSIRMNEIIVLRKMAFVWAFMNFAYACSPLFVTMAAFGAYVWLNPLELLTSSKIFVSLCLFHRLRQDMLSLPYSIIECTAKMSVAMKRINKLLNAEEMDSSKIENLSGEAKNAIEIEKASFAWSDSKNPTLNSINLKIVKGSLTAIIGKVGSGKSSLLSGILGEMQTTTGKVKRKGSVAYVPQQAWIQNMTIKDNIMFGNDISEDKYSKIIKGCALEQDLLTFKAGDQTEIGEDGINLSGGQKQRVSLARAAYSESDIYLLDDPLSAVDSHVAKHLFENVIGSDGYLSRKTRVLVTNNLSILPYVDRVIVMDSGAVIDSGSFEELKDKERFMDVLEEINVEKPKAALSDEKINEDKDPKGEATDDDTLEQKETDPLLDPGGALIEDEIAMTGMVTAKTYLNYFKNVGYIFYLFVFALYVLNQTLHVGGNFWLSVWADTNEEDEKADTESQYDFILIYLSIGAVKTFIEFFKEYIFFLRCTRAAKVIHDSLLFSVLRSPMSFFDTTPVGRILNRFSSDVNTVDLDIPYKISDFVWCFLDVISAPIIISYTTPMFLVVIIPLAIVYFIIQRIYIPSSRQLTRLESISKSPIFAHFSETLTGVVSIRAFGQEDRFITESEMKVSENNKCLYLDLSSQRWLSIRVEILGNFVTLFACLFGVLARDKISPGLLGLSITSSMSVIDTLNWMIRMVSELETNMVAMERVDEYTNNEQEASWNPVSDTDSSFPKDGSIQVQNYQTRYRKGMDLILKGINMDIKTNEKIGLCGRTGAGKSTFTLALFRIIEPSGGKIMIGDKNIRELGLHELRSKITIVPQDPVLFTGSLRFNLDPTEKNSDKEIWNALEHVHMKRHISGLKDGLDNEVSEGGENFSVGQRQLLCLARVLLRKTKIVVLDEATASIDLETDNLIQETIRREFADCTVITIAHRLNTIMSSDKIAVFKDGFLEEFDSPKELLGKEESAFKDMAKSAGLI